MVTIQSQNFGVEIEMTGVSRGTAASVIANYFGVGGIHFAGGTYQTYEAKEKTRVDTFSLKIAFLLRNKSNQRSDEAMAVFRVEKNKGYTVMSNHHLRNKELSLKAKGLLSQMLSLPEDWDYTLAGLSLINRESIDAIRTAVWELEKAGYITRRQGRDEKGKMTAIEYTIYEQPQPPALDCPVLENPTADKPILENPTPDNPTSENPTQLNKEIQKTNLPKKEKLNTDISSTHSYTSEDSDLVAVENNYAALENGLQSEIDNIESTHPGYDEYRYELDSIGHNPHELASYLTALLQSYTPQSAQAELDRIFEKQYTLTLTEEVEIRYRTETSTDPETGETTTEEVPYEYHILNVKLENKPISSFVSELLTPQQLEMFHVYLETSGNKPLIFGGGSPDGSPSEDLSGVEFVNGTRPGNQELMELAKQQVGNVGGYPYWSWYGFNSRVEWCACFVSWCYNQAGKSEPRFAGCEWQGVPWFQSRGQWGARGYENIAPGDAIFFDWDLDGVADHVGLVLGRDGSRVYTVEGNSGDACKIKSYDLNYQCIKGYGLMNW